MLNKLRKLKEEKKGAVSIIMVLFLLTLLASFSLLFDMSFTMFGLRDIQSKIDAAGINALYSSIDLEYLRNEQMAIVNNGGSISTSGVIKSGAYTNTIRNAYTAELNKIDYPGENPKVKRTNVSFEYSDFGLGYNAASVSSAKKRPQIILESIVSYDVPSSTLVDEVTRRVTKSVKSVHTGTDFQVTIQDKGVDGKKTVLVHSLTRIVLK